MPPDDIDAEALYQKRFDRLREAGLPTPILTHEGDTYMGTDPLRKNRDKNVLHKLKDPQNLHLLVLFPASNECNYSYLPDESVCPTPSSQDNFILSDDFTLSDDLWQEISLLLPSSKSEKKKAGRPRMDDRQAMTAILYRLKTGCRWKKLPRKFGASSTIYDRWREWEKKGVFNRLLKEPGIEGYTLKQNTFAKQNAEEQYSNILEHSFSRPGGV